MFPTQSGRVGSSEHGNMFFFFSEPFAESGRVGSLFKKDMSWKRTNHWAERGIK